MAWKHIPDNEEAWLYFQEGLLSFGTPTEDMHLYPRGSWSRPDWMTTPFDDHTARKNYIYLEA